MKSTYISKLTLICMIVVIGWVGTIHLAPTKASAATKQSLQLLTYGKKYIGVNYKFGAASGVTSAFDCSSYTQYIFKQLGVNLPRTSGAQASVGKKISKGSLSVGDLVFFNTMGGKRVSHVAIYAGKGKIIHASSSKGVSLASINSGYWKKYYVTARRVL